MGNVMNRYHTEAEQTRLLATVRQYSNLLARRDAAWIDLLRLSGMRIGEFSLQTLGSARLALRHGWIHIPREHRKGKRKPHEVLVTEPMRTALRALIAIAGEMGGAGGDAEPLVRSLKGGALSVRSYQERYAFWAKAAGIQGSPHWMRHTRAMNIMRRSTSKDPRGIVQAALGHSDISSSGIYTRVSKEDLVESLTAVDGPRRARRRDVARLCEEARA